MEKGSRLSTTGGIGNVWLQPLDGAASRPLTHFPWGQIYSFDWSRDGRLAYSRGLSPATLFWRATSAANEKPGCRRAPELFKEHQAPQNSSPSTRFLRKNSGLMSNPKPGPAGTLSIPLRTSGGVPAAIPSI